MLFFSIPSIKFESKDYEITTALPFAMLFFFLITTLQFIAEWEVEQLCIAPCLPQGAQMPC